MILSSILFVLSWMVACILHLNSSPTCLRAVRDKVVYMDLLAPLSRGVLVFESISEDLASGGLNPRECRRLFILEGTNKILLSTSSSSLSKPRSNKGDVKPLGGRTFNRFPSSSIVLSGSWFTSNESSRKGCGEGVVGILSTFAPLLERVWTVCFENLPGRMVEYDWREHAYHAVVVKETLLSFQEASEIGLR